MGKVDGNRYPRERRGDCVIYCDRCGEISESPDNELFGSFLCDSCYKDAEKMFMRFINKER